MPEGAAVVDEARRAFARRDWPAAAEAYARANRDPPLDPADVAAWSRSVWWQGRTADGIALAEQAFAAFRDAGRVEDAAETALRIALLRVTGAEMTLATAWMRRAESLLRDLPDGRLHAHLAYLAFFGAHFGADDDAVAGSAAAQVERLRDLAQRVPDPAARTLSLAVSGLADLRRGQVARGFAQLDEAMLGVLSEDVDPEWGGDICCATIHVCHELADHGRMSGWTRATEEWCRQFGSDAVFAGVCRVHRLELRSATGDWDDVEHALTEVCGLLGPADPWVAGAGWYQLGELRRLRGDADGAREAYALARETGIDPVPGEGLLELQAGRPDRAWHLITTALDGRDRLARTRLLRAAVEIAVATGRREAAVEFRDELRAVADDFRSAGFGAWAEHADGMLALDAGDATGAVAAFQSALAYFRRHGLRCEQARLLAWLAAAYEVGGDPGRAEHLRGEASVMFERIGARADVEVSRRAVADPGPLTARELEIVQEVARGASNRQIAERLYISEKTVGRHLANIYLKLEVGSRTAAAAWWHDRGSAGG